MSNGILNKGFVLHHTFPIAFFCKFVAAFFNGT